MKKLSLLLLCALAILLPGCASWQQAINGYEAAGLVSARAVNDNLVTVEITALCATPYSAVLRHPELWEVLPKLCAAGARENTPSTLLSLGGK